MRNPNAYTRVSYEKEFPIRNRVITWMIGGPLRLIDSILTVLFLGIKLFDLSDGTLERFRIHKLTKELQLEEKLNG